MICATPCCRRLNYEKIDERVGLMGEIVSAIRLIKMYCWEGAFGGMVDKIRRYVMHADSRRLTMHRLNTQSFVIQ